VEPTRQEFLHIGGWQQVLFYALTFASVGVCLWQIARRWELWRRGRRIEWKPRLLANFLQYVLLQAKVRRYRKRSGAPMHLMIFYGFVALFVATTLLAINTYSPWKFHRGAYYLAYEVTFDLFGAVFCVGLAWALVRRAAFRPPSLTTTWKDYWALALMLVVGITGFVLEGARIANDPKPWDAWSPVGYLVARALGPLSNDWYVGIWWFHMVWVWAFFALLPQMRIRHLVIAMLSTAGNPDRPMGALHPISMEEVEQTGQIGVTHAKDFSRWHLLSLDACMECGRCTEVCPASGVGKILNPKRVVQDVRAAMETGAVVAEQVSEEALWACTTCHACVDACPVNIRHVDLIVETRRNLVAEGKLSGGPAVMLRQLAGSSNSWGSPQSEREAWMEGLEVPLARNCDQFDVLFWVGCAGATDPGAIRTTRATAELLAKAGVRYACLGSEEKCTGDPARRVGDEFLFQDLAHQNIATLQARGVRKIVTTCPHCMNTLRNEYGPFGGVYEVVHHSELLAELVREGRLAPAGDRDRLTYHDPCYLARVNGVAEAPRDLLGPPVEPVHSGEKTLCCGAGGGRMWMDEPAEQRPGVRRAQELLATGAKTVAVGCPFCRIMLDTSIRQVTTEEIRLVELAELMREANP